MSNFWQHKTTEVQRGAKIGKGTKIWQNSQILKGAKIGENCVIGHNCFIASKAKIGNGVKLESNIDIWDLVNLEDYVFVGPSVVFTNDKNPRAKYQKSKYPKYGKWLPTLIRRGATLGANATIICGTVIGKWAMVGAGAVVNKDVPDYTIVVGIPAKFIGFVCKCGNKIGFKNGKAICKICKRKYIKENQKVIPIK
jgi:UDP-2-acetamido-3-amino-2,3-dideoxy-glucuronate N-acetyltransferase